MEKIIRPACWLRELLKIYLGNDMSAVDDLISSLDDGSFDSAVDKLLGSMDKGGLSNLMKEMEAKVGSISDQDKRHLFKNGISSIQMTLDTM